MPDTTPETENTDKLKDENLQAWLEDENTPYWMKALFTELDGMAESRLLLNRVAADLDTAQEVLDAYLSPGDPEDYGDDSEENGGE